MSGYQSEIASRLGGFVLKLFSVPLRTGYSTTFNPVCLLPQASLQILKQQPSESCRWYRKCIDKIWLSVETFSKTWVLGSSWILSFITYFVFYLSIKDALFHLVKLFFCLTENRHEPAFSVGNATYRNWSQCTTNTLRVQKKVFSHVIKHSFLCIKK